MPTYDFMCCECMTVAEKIEPSTTTFILCPMCSGISVRMISAPAGIRMGDGKAMRKAQRITEPTWVYPDGHRESLNSANTRPEE